MAVGNPTLQVSESSVLYRYRLKFSESTEVTRGFDSEEVSESLWASSSVPFLPHWAFSASWRVCRGLPLRATFGETRRANVERAIAIVTSRPAAERIPHRLPSPQRSFSISVNTWQTFPPRRVNAFQACSTGSFCRGYCAYFFPPQGLRFCRISYCHDVTAHSKAALNVSQKHSPWFSFHPFPLPGVRRTERSTQLSLLWAGNKGQKSGAVNLPPVAISRFSSGYRNILWWKVISLAHLRWKEMLKYRIFVSSSPLLFITHSKERNSNSPPRTLQVLKLLWLSVKSYIVFWFLAKTRAASGALLTFTQFHNLYKPQQKHRVSRRQRRPLPPPEHWYSGLLPALPPLPSWGTRHDATPGQFVSCVFLNLGRRGKASSISAALLQLSSSPKTS